jgi:O-antigen/teichoic acid export membrane protein
VNQRRRSAFLSMFFGYAGLMISLARNVLLVPIYLQKIPLPEYGAWLATGGALALMLVNDYGLSGVVTQRMSASYGAGDREALGGLAGSALAIGILLALALTAISSMLIPFFPAQTRLTGSENHTVVACFIIAVIANGLGVIGGTAASVLRSLQKVVIFGSINLAAEISNVTIIIVGLLMGYGLYALALGLLVRSAVLATSGLIAVWIVCHRELGIHIRVDGFAVRRLLGQSSQFFVSSISVKFQGQAPIFFVGSLLGPASAAVYSLTARAYDTVLTLIILINGSLVPSVTHLLGSGNTARFRTVVLRLVVFLSALTALAMSVTFILNPAFLALWVGKDVFAGQAVSILLAAVLFVSTIGGVGYDAMLAQGKFRLVTHLFVAASLVQAALLLALLKLGMWIAPLASLLIICFWGVGFWRSFAKDIAITRAEWRGLGTELVRLVAVSVIGALIFTAFYPAAKSWLALAIEAVVCGCCLTLAYLLSSRQLRRITYEELGNTLRVFRPT